MKNISRITDLVFEIIDTNDIYYITIKMVELHARLKMDNSTSRSQKIISGIVDNIQILNKKKIIIKRIF